MKRPSFQFYPGDWQRDTALRLCSIGARGCWMEMICIMHQAEPYGHLLVNGQPVNESQLAGLIGGLATPKQVRAWLKELEDAGVFSRDDQGRIVSRRMVRDEATREARANGGKAGSEHGIKGAEHGKKGGRPKKETGDKNPPPTNHEEENKPPLEPPPSSSSSSSSSNLSPNLSHENSEGGDSAGTAESDESPYGDPRPAGRLAKALRTLGVQVTPANPDFLAWVSAGLTAEEATAGVEIARSTKPAPEPLPWAYLAKVLTTQRQQAKGSVPKKPIEHDPTEGAL